MGYFSGLNSYSFQKNAEGKTIFLFGNKFSIPILWNPDKDRTLKGYIIEDPKLEKRLKAITLANLFLITIIMLIVIQFIKLPEDNIHFLLIIAAAFVLGGIDSLFIKNIIKIFTKRLPQVDFVITKSEYLEHTSTAFGQGVLLLLAISSVLIMLGSLFFLLNKEQWLLGLFGILFSGLGLVVSIRMIWAHDDAEQKENSA